MSEPETAPPLTVSAAELAEHWGITERRLRELSKDGIAVRAGRGFDLVESDRRYIAKLRSHDESRRLKARLLERQTQRQEVRLHQDTGALLTRAEAAAEFERWWGRVWDAVTGAIARNYYALSGTDEERRVICWRVYNDIRGELLLQRARISELELAPRIERKLDEHLKRLGISATDPEADD